MGSAWSFLQSTNACTNIDCAAVSNDFQSGATVAGIGTFVLFFLTVLLTLLLSLINILRQASDRFRLQRGTTSKRLQRKLQDDAIRNNAITEAVILNFSDQQLVTGLAMAITTRFLYQCGMTAYHYDMVCYMLLCSVTTHLASLLAVDKYFYPFDKSKGAFASKLALLVGRCLGIFVVLVLTGLVLFNRNQHTFPVEPATDGLLRPAVCFFTGANVQSALENVDDSFKGFFAKNWTHGLVQYVIFVACIVITVPVAVLHSFERGCSHKLRHPTFLLMIRIGILALACVVSAWTFSLAYRLRHWMDTQGNPGDASNVNEWTFSQVLAVSILIFSPITALDAAAEKYDLRKRGDGPLGLEQIGKPVDSGYTLVHG